MITKNDCMSILVRLEDDGININQYMRKLAVSKDIPIDVLRFIAQHRGIEIANFYEVLRKSHNEKKSPLYTNILKEIKDDNEVITTLTALLTQIALYARKANVSESFFKEVRANEITHVLEEYFVTFDMSGCKSLLKLIKSDILVLEYIAGRRELLDA